MKPRLSRIALILFLTALVITSAACSFSALQIEGGQAKVTITLNEQQLNDLLDNNGSKVESRDAMLKEITRVDMQESIIRVYGIYDAPDGSEAEGSYDIAVTAEDGKLDVQIKGVDMEGVALDDPRIEEINRELENDLSTAYNESHGDVTYESVEISDDAMTMVVLADLSNK